MAVKKMESVTLVQAPNILMSCKTASTSLAVQIAHCWKNQKCFLCRCAGVSKIISVLSCLTCYILKENSFNDVLSYVALPEILEDSPAVSLHQETSSQPNQETSSQPTVSLDSTCRGPPETPPVSGKNAMRDYLFLLACNPGTL